MAAKVTNLVVVHLGGVEVPALAPKGGGDAVDDSSLPLYVTDWAVQTRGVWSWKGAQARTRRILFWNIVTAPSWGIPEVEYER